ncbi:MAG TPA: vanadium-dependent haloperoxidase [Candidatus Polarisedimenticolaceae bacterium]
MRMLLPLLLACSTPVLADAVTDWNAIGCDAVEEAKLLAPPATEILAVVHTAIYDAVRAAPASASRDAAIAAAARECLTKLLPSTSAKVEAAYDSAISKIPEGPAKSAGIAVGVRAASELLAKRGRASGSPPDDYRPHTTPGVYVPTVIPVMTRWAQQPPWWLRSASQFRPGPPPDLKSALWARDFAEIRAVGAKQGGTRTEEQTRIAKFWEATGPSIYHRLVRSVADRPGRDLVRNARLFAMVSQGSTDALIAVFDAKYHYGFWRPVTAIRNGDIDGNDATDRDATWLPFIDTPMHPEYPCAHCILSATVGTIVEADLAGEPVPTLTSSSPTAGGATRSWTSIEAFVQEVANARIYDGVHYRNSTEVGTAMGRKVGAWVVDAFASGSPPRSPTAP